MDGLSVKTIKNKLDSLRKKGKALAQKHLKPLLSCWTFPTSSDAPADGPPPYPLSLIDWDSVIQAVKWPNIRTYFDLFGKHPTWVRWEVKETGVLISDNDGDDVPSLRKKSDGKENER